MNLATVPVDAVVEVAAQSPGFVHYLPILTTVVSAAFLIVLIRRAAPKGWPPHLVW